MNEIEILKKENEQLKATIQELRKQLQTYKVKSKRQFYSDQDYVSYPDEERHGNDSATLG